MSTKIIEELYGEIKKRNAESGDNCIPQSDEFIKLMSATLGIPAEQVSRFLEVLVNSHRVFSFEIVHSDESRDVPRVDAYVATEIITVRRLRNMFQQELVRLYAQQFKKDLMVHQVVREIFPIIRSLNNTPIGKAANKAIMLDELEKMMEKDFQEFTEDQKERLLHSELERLNLVEDADKKSEKPAGEKKERATSTPSTGERGGNRAVDSRHYGDFITKKSKYPLQRILNIYGVEFFLKVNLRNCQYEYLKKLIEDNQLYRRNDLIVLKDMLRTVKNNADVDPRVKEGLEEIYELEKAIHHRMYFSERKVKKPEPDAAG